MSGLPEEVVRFATLWILMIVPAYKVGTIRKELRAFRRDGQGDEGPLPWHRRFEEYRRETYVPEAGPLVDRLHAWTKVCFGALGLVLVGFIVWGLVSPILR